MRASALGPCPGERHAAVCVRHSGLVGRHLAAALRFGDSSKRTCLCCMVNCGKLTVLCRQWQGYRGVWSRFPGTGDPDLTPLVQYKGLRQFRNNGDESYDQFNVYSVNIFRNLPERPQDGFFGQQWYVISNPPNLWPALVIALHRASKQRHKHQRRCGITSARYLESISGVIGVGPRNQRAHPKAGTTPSHGRMVLAGAAAWPGANRGCPHLLLASP